MFIDKAVVLVKGGKGGNGAVSFRHEKFIDRGGPDGGDGGKGGDVIVQADPNINTLLNFRYKQELKAEDGEAGAKRRKHGKSGANLVIKVPVGTSIYHNDLLVVDLITPEQQKVIAYGGEGGFGNAHFISSVRQAPRVAEVGAVGEEYELRFELKLLADVGLVGLPNAGKSTFLSVVTSAKPEIADYPFTTLTPHLGVAKIDDSSLLIADIPGLIEGAASGKGLGHEFLKHVERTGVLLHLIDAYSNDIVKDYKIIRQELGKYSKDLAKRSEIVAITKTEGLDEEITGDILSQLRQHLPKKTKVYAISSRGHKGLTEVLRDIAGKVREEQIKKSESAPNKRSILHITLANDELAWQVKKVAKNTFQVSGKKIEKFASRTDFNSYHGRERLRSILKKMGIMHELMRQGAGTTSTIAFNGQKSSISLAED
jgi:GTPase